MTWVVFSHLLRTRQLSVALVEAGLISVEASTVVPTLLLWGVPIDSDTAGTAIQEKLKRRCRELGERANSFSEPDVVIDLGGFGLIFIEVKYRCRNDIKTRNYNGWESYAHATNVGWEADEVVNSGLYELARNWCLLKGTAGDTDRNGLFEPHSAPQVPALN